MGVIVTQLVIYGDEDEDVAVGRWSGQDSLSVSLSHQQQEPFWWKKEGGDKSGYYVMMKL